MLAKPLVPFSRPLFSSSFRDPLSQLWQPLGHGSSMQISTRHSCLSLIPSIHACRDVELYDATKEHKEQFAEWLHELCCAAEDEDEREMAGVEQFEIEDEDGAGEEEENEEDGDDD